MCKKRRIPLFLQGDARWGQQPYGNTVMADCGCGPTSLAMVVCGLTGNTVWNPSVVAQYAIEHAYYIPGFGTSLEMMTEGAQAMGLRGVQVAVDSAGILESLSAGAPMICRMGPGDFIDGDDTHFIVLAGLGDEGKVLVNDPLSEENSQKAWDAGKLASQMLEAWKYTTAIRACLRAKPGAGPCKRA